MGRMTWFFCLNYMKNIGEGGQMFSLLHEKQRAGWTNFQKTHKRTYPSIIHLRVLYTQSPLIRPTAKWPALEVLKILKI